jgi:hypothetical protein
MMRVPERPEISSATLAFAGNGEIRAGMGARRKDGFLKSCTEGTEEDAQRALRTKKVGVKELTGSGL